MMPRILLSLVLAVVRAAPVWAGFEEGIAAYERDGRWQSREIPRLSTTWTDDVQPPQGCLRITKKQPTGSARPQGKEEIVTPRPIWKVSICWELDSIGPFSGYLSALHTETYPAGGRIWLLPNWFSPHHAQVGNLSVTGDQSRLS